MAYQAFMQGEKLRKGPWFEEEDERLTTSVTLLGDRRWDSIARASGLKRSGRSCRLRWMNYLRPNLKHGHISAEEEQIILQLHQRWGNKWSRIARRLPGRTDNEIKNYWRTHLGKRAQVQEQDNFQCQINSAKQDCLSQKGDTSVKKYENENHGSVQDHSLGTTGNSFDVLDLSNFAFARSPYETRLSDWISEMSNNQSMEHHGDCNSVESCFCYLAWNSEEGDTSIWEYSDSLWDNLI